MFHLPALGTALESPIAAVHSKPLIGILVGPASSLCLKAMLRAHPSRVCDHAPSPSFLGLRVFAVVRKIDLGLAAKTHSSGLFGNPQKKSEDGRGSWRRSKGWAAHGLEGANKKRSGGPPCLELLECLADFPTLLDPLSICPGPKDPALLDPTRLGVPSSLISKLRSPT
ncbi:hypothetical protein BDK51DRAFT_33034 [Blyttiomyces helicus]|uniref:Uncharacterized protein n=1 Tax=Blyttiomyces helicus TaxID=388810 RepID=A0A4V1IPV1_9FUNG|nr:hypothetical protein BDK51DRAFT_33034 [Blyttiomyces helicus]|eukprot:RKO84337.1 hypothetical protein BDK51DRAFT_33034 [Blyttiomyces helicus]